MIGVSFVVTNENNVLENSIIIYVFIKVIIVRVLNLPFYDFKKGIIKILRNY